jgi:drug/metabolite transporter (DMT)-like permease
VNDSWSWPITLGHLPEPDALRGDRAGWAVLGEAVHAYHVVGAALVIAGVVLTTR